MIQANNYITIQGFMVTDLHLKGNELLIYALVYGFSQDGENEFTGSLAYIMEWFGMTKKTAIETLKSLVEKGLITKKETEVAKNIKLCSYKANTSGVKITPPVKKLQHGGVKISMGRCKNVTASGVKITPNNNTNNNTYKNNNKSHSDKFGFGGREYDFDKLEETIISS